MTAADFIQPTGELSADLFPGTDLEVAVTVWIADAVARSDNVNAQRSWVLHRAYSAVANRLNAGVASGREGEVSGARIAEQFRYFNNLARRHLAAYQSIATVQSAVTEVRPVW